MSTRDDASLTGRERAALASLEAMATADDPELASRLRGARFHFLTKHRPVPAWLRNRWWGGPLTVLGLFLAVLGLSTGFGVGLLGVVLAGIGLWLLVQAIGDRWPLSGQGPGSGQGPEPGCPA